jgi:hypothetical protein
MNPVTRVKQDKNGRNRERNKRGDIKNVNKYKTEIRNVYYATDQSTNT